MEGGVLPWMFLDGPRRSALVIVNLLSIMERFRDMNCCGAEARMYSTYKGVAEESLRSSMRITSEHSRSSLIVDDRNRLAVAFSHVAAIRLRSTVSFSLFKCHDE